MNDSLSVVRETAAEHGFGVVGVTSAEPLVDALAALEAWTRDGHGAAMRWMTRNPPERADPRTLLEDVRTVVILAIDYGDAEPEFRDEGRYARIARYAWGRDYHDVVIPRLRSVGQSLVERLDARRFAVACDHSPLLERAAAARAGVGFIGKNTCLLRPRAGSFSFLAEILLDGEVPPTTPNRQVSCGRCVRCLDACPTAALVSPYVLDARRCVSYLTIEHRGVLPRDLRNRLGAWVFGCDDCQDVCPFNRFAESADWPEFEAQAGAGPRLDLVETLDLRSDDDFAVRFADTPLKRTGREGLLRNAAVVARNIDATCCVPALRACILGDAEAVVRAHALWALFGLAPAAARALAERALSRDPDPRVHDEARAGLDASS